MTERGGLYEQKMGRIKRRIPVVTFDWPAEYIGATDCEAYLAAGKFDVSKARIRAARKIVDAAFRFTGKRPSRGWRRHVRRMKQFAGK